MNYKSTKYLLTAIVAFIVIIGSSCKKSNLNLDKYSNLKIKPEVLMPLAQISTNAWDLLKNTDSIRQDGDGLIRFVVSDSLTTIGADSILKKINLPVTNAQFKLGEIEIPDNSKQSFKTLGRLVSTLSDTAQMVFITSQGKDTIFPVIDRSSTDTTHLPKPTNYEFLKISKGYLVVTVENGFPVEISNMIITIRDNFANTDLGTVNILNILPGAMGKDSINIAGKTLNNDFSYTLNNIKTIESPNPVRVDSNDIITIGVFGNGMKCVGGKGIIPSQSIEKQYLSFDLSSSKDDYKIRNILFGTANLAYTAESKFAETFNLDITFKDATVGGTPLATTNMTLPTGIKSGNFDLSNTNIFMGADPVKDYNILRLDVSSSINSSGNMVDFDSSDFVKISLDPAGAEIKYVDGYLGERSWSLANETISFPDLQQFAKGITLTNPKMTIKVKNSFGLPIQVDLKLVAKNNAGASVDVQPDSMVFGYPLLAQAGTSVSSSFSIDKSNSKIVEALALPPTQFEVQGTAYLNKEGFKGYTNFVGDYSQISLGFEADVPLSLTAQDVTISDTSQDVSGTLNGVEKFDFLELKIKTENGFPMDGTLDLHFVDANYNILDSVVNTTLIASGIPDVTGKVITATENSSTFVLSNSILQNIGFGKCKYILFKVKLNTYQNGSVPVSVHAQNRLFISLAFRGKLSGN